MSSKKFIAGALLLSTSFLAASAFAGGQNDKEKYYGYVDAKKYLSSNPPRPSASQPLFFERKPSYDRGLVPSLSDYYVVPHRNDSSRVGDKVPYLYQPRRSYEFNSMTPRRYPKP